MYKRICIIYLFLFLYAGCLNDKTVLNNEDKIKEDKVEGKSIKILAEWKGQKFWESPRSMDVIYNKISKTWKMPGRRFVFCAVIVNEKQMEIVEQIVGGKIDVDFERNEVLVAIRFSHADDIGSLKFSAIRGTEDKRIAYLKVKMGSRSILQKVVSNARYHIVVIEKKDLPVEFKLGAEHTER